MLCGVAYAEFWLLLDRGWIEEVPDNQNAEPHAVTRYRLTSSKQGRLDFLRALDRIRFSAEEMNASEVQVSLLEWAEEATEDLLSQSKDILLNELFEDRPVDLSRHYLDHEVQRHIIDTICAVLKQAATDERCNPEYTSDALWARLYTCQALALAVDPWRAEEGAEALRAYSEWGYANAGEDCERRAQIAEGLVALHEASEIELDKDKYHQIFEASQRLRATGAWPLVEAIHDAVEWAMDSAISVWIREAREFTESYYEMPSQVQAITEAKRRRLESIFAPWLSQPRSELLHEVAQTVLQRPSLPRPGKTVRVVHKGISGEVYLSPRRMASAVALYYRIGMAQETAGELYPQPIEISELSSEIDEGTYLGQQRATWQVEESLRSLPLPKATRRP